MLKWAPTAEIEKKPQTMKNGCLGTSAEIGGQISTDANHHTSEDINGIRFIYSTWLVHTVDYTGNVPFHEIYST